MNEDIHNTIAEEWIIEEINDKVLEGFYSDSDRVKFDPANINIDLVEPEEHKPTNLEGETKEKLACNDYDEHCRACKKSGCKTLISIKWKASFKMATDEQLTYYVEKI